MRCKIVPSTVGITSPSIEVWNKKTYRINRIHMPIKGKVLYKDVNGSKLLEEGYAYLMINSSSKNFEILPEYGYYHMFLDFQTFPPLLSQEVIEVDMLKDLYLHYLLKALETVMTERMHREGKTRLVYKEEPVWALVKPILDQIVSYFQIKYNVRVVENPKLEAAVHFIEEHYAEHLCNDNIAEILHIDTRYLIRLFTKHLGMSPYLYLTQCRIEHALGFLREGKSVSETAFLCGYQSENAFRIAFKKTMGAPPTQFLKQK